MIWMYEWIWCWFVFVHYHFTSFSFLFLLLFFTFLTYKLNWFFFGPCMMVVYIDIWMEKWNVVSIRMMMVACKGWECYLNLIHDVGCRMMVINEEFIFKFWQWWCCRWMRSGIWFLLTMGDDWLWMIMRWKMDLFYDSIIQFCPFFCDTQDYMNNDI